MSLSLSTHCSHPLCVLSPSLHFYFPHSFSFGETFLNCIFRFSTNWGHFTKSSQLITSKLNTVRFNHAVVTSDIYWEYKHTEWRKCVYKVKYICHMDVCVSVCVPQTCHSKTQECQHVTCTDKNYTVPISHTPILACIRSLAALIWSVADGWNNKNTVVGTNTQLSALLQCTAHGYISTSMLLTDVPSADHLNPATIQWQAGIPNLDTWQRATCIPVSETMLALFNYLLLSTKLIKRPDVAHDPVP